jgi:hypothetical protein
MLWTQEGAQNPDDRKRTNLRNDEPKLKWILIDTYLQKEDQGVSVPFM